MQVSLETVSDLERKLTISLAENDITEEVNSRLKKLAPKVQIQGFRQGKVPMSMVRQRYSNNVRQEVVQELMQNALQETIEKEALKLADYPKINVQSGFETGDFCFEAHIEIIPEVSLNELENIQVELIEAEVDTTDVDEMMLKLLDQHKEWKDVERASKNGDKVIIDFKGFVDDVPFEGGEATQFEFVLGEKKMLPDFEKGLLKHKKDEEFDIDVTFPEDYNQKDLAGKKARFSIKVHHVQAGELPELNDEFAVKFGVDKGVDALKEDIHQNMHRELKKQVSAINRKTVFDHFMEKNPTALPSGLIDREIHDLKHQFFHKIYGPEHHDNEKIPDFPRELFVEEATRRVHLSLLYAEYIKKHQLAVDNARLETLLEETVAAFEKPAEAKEWYLKDKERLGNLESLLMEELVMEKILECAKPNLKKMNYRETMEFAKTKEGESK